MIRWEYLRRIWEATCRDFFGADSAKSLFFPHCRLRWSCKSPKTTPALHMSSLTFHNASQLYYSWWLWWPSLFFSLLWHNRLELQQNHCVIEDGTIVIQVQEIPPKRCTKPSVILSTRFSTRMFSLPAIKSRAWNLCSFIQRAILTSTSVTAASWQKNVQTNCKSCWVNKKLEGNIIVQR